LKMKAGRTAMMELATTSAGGMLCYQVSTNGAWVGVRKIDHDPTDVFGAAITDLRTLINFGTEEIWVDDGILGHRKIDAHDAAHFTKHVLCRIMGNSHCFIGSELFTFKTKAPIAKFTTGPECGNPWAIDIKGNIYVFDLGVILLPSTELVNKALYDPSFNAWDHFPHGESVAYKDQHGRRFDIPLVTDPETTFDVQSKWKQRYPSDFAYPEYLQLSKREFIKAVTDELRRRRIEFMRRTTID